MIIPKANILCCILPLDWFMLLVLYTTVWFATQPKVHVFYIQQLPRTWVYTTLMKRKLAAFFIFYQDVSETICPKSWSFIHLLKVVPILMTVEGFTTNAFQFQCEQSLSFLLLPWSQMSAWFKLELNWFS